MKYFLVESVDNKGKLFECIVTEAQYKKMEDEPHCKKLKIITADRVDLPVFVQPELRVGGTAYLYNGKCIHIRGIQNIEDKVNDIF